jgi:glyoxylase-like metal-dependent hydrolase (beta-lactamase superfamily II)
MDHEQPVPGIYLIPVPTPYLVGPVNCYLIDGAAPVLVDCGHGMPAAEAALRAALLDLGVAPADLALVLLTHHHFDHAGGLGWLRRASMAPVAGHPWNDLCLRPSPERVRARDHFFQELYRFCGYPAIDQEEVQKHFKNDGDIDYPPIGRPLGAGTTLEMGGRSWDVYETPGHAGTSISLVRDDGVAIVGDTLLSRVSSNAIVEPPYSGQSARTPTLLAYRASLRLLASLPITTVLPGHGPPFTDHAALIERRLAAQDARARRLLAGLEEGRDTVRSLSEMLFPTLQGDQRFLGLSEVLGHLDLLEEDGLAVHRGTNPAHYVPR